MLTEQQEKAPWEDPESKLSLKLKEMLERKSLEDREDKQKLDQTSWPTP